MATNEGGFIGQDGLNAPDSPTGVSGSAGNEKAVVSFTAPSDVGGSAITGFRVQDGTNAHGASGTSSPITVTGLSNGTSYTFNVWAINAFGYSAPSDASGSVSPAAPIGLFAGGELSAGKNSNIDVITMATTGNATDFGDLSFGGGGLSSGAKGTISSATRGLFAGGQDFTPGDAIDVIQFVTFSSAGNTSDFGDLPVAVHQTPAGISNSTRGITAGGYTGSFVNSISYVTIAAEGNASDFGDLSQTTARTTGMASPTRGLVCGGYNGSSSVNTISYITIGSTGNSSDFGDLSATKEELGSASSSTRGLVAGGYATGVGEVNVIEYVTIASTGNALDFGDLTEAVQANTALSSSTRFVRGGGKQSTSFKNTMDYVTIASTGNATDFGDLNFSAMDLMSSSGGHGGLS